jgi:hypothetical protein
MMGEYAREMTILRNKLYDTQLELAQLKRAVADIKDAYEWWTEDQYDRDQGVVYDAVMQAVNYTIDKP